MSGPADRQLMRRALRLAERGWGRVHPNPMVGALVVRDGVIVGSGYHVEYGGPHAEIVALRAAGGTARGATLYVTLEPCTHHGKTPPCTTAIVEAGIRKVVFAASDPNPRAGGGASLLAASGVEIVAGIEAADARSLNAAFFHEHEHGDCYVGLKLALSLDAKLGAVPGQRSMVTGPAALRAVHELRAGFDGIMVGSGTVVADDPLLTVRGGREPRLPPVRVVVDSQARLSPASRLVRGAADVPVWLFCAETVDAARTALLESVGVRVFHVAAGLGGVALDEVLETLRAEDVRTVLCEGGGRMAATLLRLDVVDRLHLFYAPVVFGADGIDAFPTDGPLPACVHWRLYRTRRHGADVQLVFDRVRAQA